MNAAAWRDANLRWLLAGGALSLVGDQFTLIALPWLVLQITGDALALGFVIALMSVPRAVFILLGGALVDRYSPKHVMMLSKYASVVLLGTLAGLTWGGHASMAVVYVLAFGIGLAQAFAMPSGTAMLPRAVPGPLLGPANGMMMGLRQLALLAGPLLAALLLALAPATAGNVGMRALAVAFAIDCASFILSAWTLAQVRLLDLPGDTGAPAREPVLRSVASGLVAVWRDVPLRTCFLYWGLVSLFVGGALQVALPLLASDTLRSAPAYGVLMGAHGAGTLLGMAGSTLLPRLKAVPFGALLLAADVVAGLLLMPLGGIHATWQGAVLLIVLGLLSGFLQVAIFTWIQRRVAPQMLGRAMSIFLFIFMGLAPLSAAATGWLLQHMSLATLFTACGGTLVACATLAWLWTPMRTIAMTPPATQQD
ncbi:MFS transporter [Pseudoduganella chitinolytica]|uniref:MFS transporter n=1 Tax=Pseudoduganella chitinolytica TaxID=34070 RepID=A0ABY8BHW7_9BURK|nr:MFS transporter [Pseudoduganella chitinolytica]WEF35261.1 MFS transporter [Pseudoduganella chitinolytica]